MVQPAVMAPNCFKLESMENIIAASKRFPAKAVNLSRVTTKTARRPLNPQRKAFPIVPIWSKVAVLGLAVLVLVCGAVAVCCGVCCANAVMGAAAKLKSKLKRIIARIGV